MERFDSIVHGLLLVLLIAGIQASCGPGRFGESCRYSCNCQVECDQDTGACPGNCSAGWVKGGQLCQKQNIAYKKKAWTYRPTYKYKYKHWPATNAVDGDNNIRGEDGTCFHGEPGSNYLAIDLGKKFKLYHMRLYLRHKFESRIASAKISDYYNSSSVCYTFPSSIPNNPTDVVCDMMVQTFRINKAGKGGTLANTVLNICEVEIYQCSPGTYGKDCNYFCHCSDCDIRTGVCTGDCFEGWQGDRCDIKCSRGTYGKDCNYFCHCSDCDIRTGVCTGDCFEGWQGTRCDIECNPNFYGRNCSKLCTKRNCHRKSSCNHSTGACDNGCKKGWTGTDCRQKCVDSYGFNCNMKCADRMCAGKLLTCDRVKGSCDPCLPGWQGADCTKECDDLQYGMNCARKCKERHCRGKESSCNRVSGRCDQGCLPGWRGNDCIEEKIERLKVGEDLFVIAVAVVGCLAAIVVVIIVVVIIRRRLLGANRSRKPRAVDNEYADIDLEESGSKSANFERKHIPQPAVSVLEQGRSLDTKDAEDTYSVCTRDWEGEEDGGTGDYCNLDEVRRDHSTSIPVSQLLDKISEFRKNPKSVEEEYKVRV